MKNTDRCGTCGHSRMSHGTAGGCYCDCSAFAVAEVTITRRRIERRAPAVHGWLYDLHFPAWYEGPVLEGFDLLSIAERKAKEQARVFGGTVRRAW